MTISVVMLTNVFGAGGTLLAAGSTQSLADDFAAELVRKGRATYVTAPANPADFRLPVYRRPDGTLEDEAGSQVSGGGSPSDFNILPYLTKGHLEGPSGGGSWQKAASGGNPQTWQVQTVLESDFDAIQIGVYNFDTVSVAGITACGLSPATLQADNNVASNYNGATWTDFTFGGASSGTANASDWLWSDVMQLPSTDRADSGKTLPILNLRLGYTAGVNFSYMTGPGASGASWESDTAAVGNRPFRVRLQAVAAASNATKAALTSTTSGTAFWPPILIRYWPRNGAARTIVIVGDSQASNIGGAVSRYHWAQRFQAAVSTKARPVEIVGCGIGGGTYPQFLTHATPILPQVPDATVIFQNGTSNGTGATLSASDPAGWRWNKAKLREILRANGQKPIITTMVPVAAVSKPWGATDSVRQAMNALELTDADVKVFDYAADLSGGVDGSGQVIEINTNDNIHGNDTGAELGAVRLASLLKL